MLSVYFHMQDMTSIMFTYYNGCYFKFSINFGNCRMTDLQQDSPLECMQAGISKELSSSSVRSSRSSDSGIGCDHDCALSPSDSNPQLIPILENTGGAVCDQEETEKVEEEEDIFTTR